MPEDVLVIGATGTVGRVLVPALANAGLRPRAFVRDLEKARRLVGDHADLVIGDLADPDVLRSALTEMDALFLACGNGPDQVALECAAIDAAQDAGVSRVVKLSARGAAPDASATAWRAHAAIEEHLIESGLESVILRPSFFMTNLLAAATPVWEHNLLPAAAGDTPIAMIHPVDIAAVAARALLDESVTPGVVHLSGSAALTYDAVARHLSQVLHREITYLDLTPSAALQGMITTGLPETTATMILEIFAALRHGAYATAHDVVPRWAGRPAITISEFAREHAADLRGPGAPMKRKSSGHPSALAAVFVPGLAGHAAEFDVLAQHWVHGPTLRLNPDYDGDLSIAGLARQVADKAQQADFARYVVIGHSQGGLVALELAISRPDVVAAVAVLDSPVLLPKPLRAALRLFAAAIGTPLGPLLLQTFFRATFTEADEPAHRAAVLHRLSGVRRSAAQRIVGAAFAYDGASALSSVRVPTLCIRATIPTRLDRLPTGVRGRQIDGGGHWIHVHRPHEVGDELAELVAAVAHPSRAA